MMRKILILSPCDVFPPVHGSSTAIYHTLQFLSETNQVSALLCYLYSQRGEADLASSNLQVRYCRESTLDRLGYKGLLFNPLYFRAAWQMANAIQPDIIQAELLWTAPTALWLRRRLGRLVLFPVKLSDGFLGVFPGSGGGNRGFAVGILGEGSATAQ